MKLKVSLFFIFALLGGTALAAQQTVTVGTSGSKASLDTNFGNIQSNFTELYGQYATKWVSGKAFTADNNMVAHGGKVFICILNHTAGASSEPGTGGSWSTYWKYSGSDLYQPAMTAASQAEMEAGTEANLRSMSPLRVKQAIAALAGTGGMVYPSGTGIPYVNAGASWGTTLGLDTDLSSVSASDDTVPSAKATKTALDAKANATGISFLANALTDILMATTTNPTGEPLIAIAPTDKTKTAYTAGQVDTLLAGKQAADANLPTWPSAVSAIEVGYLDGVSSAIQAQIDNKSPLVASTVDGSASGSLSAAQVSGTIINNYGQDASDVSLTLPTAAAGYNALFVVGTAQTNKWGVQAGTNDKIYLLAADGTIAAGSDNGYARMTNAQIGQSFACWTFKTGSSTWDWMCKAGSIGTSTFAAN